MDMIDAVGESPQIPRGRRLAVRWLGSNVKPNSSRPPKSVEHGFRGVVIESELTGVHFGGEADTAISGKIETDSLRCELLERVGDDRAWAPGSRRRYSRPANR